MRPRGVDGFGAGVDTGHSEAQARHRFGDKAAAAADVEQGEPIEWLQPGGIATEVCRQLLADKAQPGWIDAVQYPETSLGIPPAVGLRGKFPDTAPHQSNPETSLGIPPAVGLRSEAADFSGIDGAAGRAQLAILIARYNRPNGTGSPKELWECAVASARWVPLAPNPPCADLPLTDSLSSGV